MRIEADARKLYKEVIIPTPLDLTISKPNIIIKTNNVSIFWNYLALVCKAEIPYPPPFYLNCKFLLMEDVQEQLSKFINSTRPHFNIMIPHNALNICTKQQVQIKFCIEHIQSRTFRIPWLVGSLSLFPRVVQYSSSSSLSRWCNEVKRAHSATYCSFSLPWNSWHWYCEI